MSVFDDAGLRALLRGVADGTLDVEAAAAELRDLPFHDVADARVDHHRALRTGLPEVIFGASKTRDQIERIARELLEREGFALATRVNAADGHALATLLPGARYAERARLLIAGARPRTGERLAVVCAGTSDLPVADEAALTLDAFGHDVVRQTDVGVAGLHRLLVGLPALDEARAVIVVAGMEGALPGVVAGLTRAPVIAVPTSVGYGVSTGGFAALLTMLSACAPGVAVVNVDNGFGAAALAHKIAQPARTPRS